MCPRDGFVVFRNSELLCGRLGKQALGGGNKASLFQARGAGLHRTRVAMHDQHVERFIYVLFRGRVPAQVCVAAGHC